MTQALQPLQVDEARYLALRGFGILRQPKTWDDASPPYAEAVRASLWSHWSNGEEGVYVTRVLNTAARLLLPWVAIQAVSKEEADGDTIRVALEELETVGDVVSLPHGRWLPAPLRVVPLQSAKRWLLVGGAPTAILPTTAQTAIEHTAAARLLAQPPQELGLNLDEQTEQSWCGSPAEPIEEWARSILQIAQLDSFLNQGERFELYAPQVKSLTASQYHRWVRLEVRLQDGRYLARIQARHGGRIYSVVQVQRQQIIAMGKPNLGSGDVRRLLYGIDLCERRPVRVQVKRKNDFWTFSLQSELPRAEHRLFVALGRLRLQPDGAYYPRSWEIPAAYAAHANEALRAIGIQVDEQ